MGEFIDAALGFPTALFSFSLLAVAGYWLLVLAGGADIEALDADTGVELDAPGAGAGGFAGFMAGLGLGGVPVTVALSLLIAISWFLSLAGTVLVNGLQAITKLILSIVILIVALLGAWFGTRLLVRPLRKAFTMDRAPNRRDFVGRMCAIRTGRVTADFGQAEVTSDDGSTALIQVRQPDGGNREGDEPLKQGSAALIFDYDAVGEVFLVMPYDVASDPDRPNI